MAGTEGESLRQSYESAEQKRYKLTQSSSSSNSDQYQALLESCISQYRKSSSYVDRASVFSPNESIDDIASSDIRYLLIDHHLADLVCRIGADDRKSNLESAQELHVKFLQRVDSYEILNKADSRMLGRYQDSPRSFTVASGTDPALKRETKIQRFKAEKELKKHLETLRKRTSTGGDEEIVRETYLQEVHLAVHESFQSLESINQELHILSMAPAEPLRARDSNPTDNRDRTRDHDGFTERLDGPLSAGLKGPLLDAKGRPMRPFTLLDKRQQLQQGVFRPDHSLPTMTIDEYLEEERKRGGIIEGGGAQSAMQPEPDEDDIEKADAATIKARAWDDFKDENPKGAGNTLNRG